MQNNFYVAGASSRARTVRVYLEYLNPDMRISAFLVSPEMTDNDPVVDGAPVLPISVSHVRAASRATVCFPVREIILPRA